MNPCRQIIYFWNQLCVKLLFLEEKKNLTLVVCGKIIFKRLFIIIVSLFKISYSQNLYKSIILLKYAICRLQLRYI